MGKKQRERILQEDIAGQKGQETDSKEGGQRETQRETERETGSYEGRQRYREGSRSKNRRKRYTGTKQRGRRDIGRQTANMGMKDTGQTERVPIETMIQSDRTRERQRESKRKREREKEIEERKHSIKTSELKRYRASTLFRQCHLRIVARRHVGLHVPTDFQMQSQCISQLSIQRRWLFLSSYQTDRLIGRQRQRRGRWG